MGRPAKTPTQIQNENEQITYDSLSMMEDLVETNKRLLEVLTDIAGMFEDLLENLSNQDMDEEG